VCLVNQRKPTDRTRTVSATNEDATIEIHLDPAHSGPGPTRADIDEHFEVLAGHVQVTIGGLTRLYRDGESFIVPRGVDRELEAAAGETARLRLVPIIPTQPQDGDRRRRTNTSEGDRR
jgi:quercetin dioxygenase-like cupin family protein